MDMIIYTNEGNPLAFQLHLLGRFAGRTVKVEKINLTEAKDRGIISLPTVELDGLKLFSCTAVARYLFPDVKDTTQNEWYEWSGTILTPNIFNHHLQNSTKGLSSHLMRIETHLQTSNYLGNEDKISPADLFVWSTLSVGKTSTLWSQDGAKDLSKLRNWHKNIAENAVVKEILALESLSSFSWNALRNSNVYGGFPKSISVHHHQSAKENKNDTTSNQAQQATFSETELKAAKEHFVQKIVKERKESRTVLPRVGERNVLITSALPYVNNVPHLGNIIGCVLSADIFARYCRAAGYNTLYISGTDEYGTATENKALAENLTPREICDKYFEIHNNVYRWFGIGFDYFGRTTTQEQTEIVQEAFLDVYRNGYVISESVDQLLCTKCDRFLADRFVEGICPHPECGYEDARGDQCDKCGKLVNAIDLIKPRCKVCSSAPEIKSSQQLFLDLPKLEERLSKWVESSEDGWTSNAKVITRAWLKEGLKPRCISRDLKWGIPVPLEGFEKKVFYVWFDAPFGYVSMTKRYTKEYQKWWQPANDTNVELFQFMAKDNVPFHSVVWPSALLAIDKGHVLVSHIMATEYLNYEDGKFSKSRGIGVFGNDAQDSGIPADVWRFYLASARPEGQDSSFSWSDLAARNNFELLNNLGNFVNRALVFCEKNFNAIIGEMNLSEVDLQLLASINSELSGYISSMECAKLRDGIKYLLAISRHGNGYMQSQQPWVLLKGNPEQKSRAETVISLSCNIACLLANLLLPFMPTTARTLFEQLNTKQTLLNAKEPFMSKLLPTGHKIGKPVPLFTKLENDFIQKMRQKYSGGQEPKKEEKIGEPAPKKITDIKELEEAIQSQGNKVRQLKASNPKDKSVWQPEVNILLDLKAQLEAAKSNSSNTNEKSNCNKSQKIEDLQLQITKQGERVRSLKATEQPDVWKPEVEILLALKKQLAALTGETLTNKKTKTKK